MRYFLLLSFVTLFFSCNNNPATPNIILFIFDQSPFDYTPGEGYNFTEGTVFEEIAAQGVVFDQAFTASPHLELYKQSLMKGLHTGHLLPEKNKTISSENLNTILQKKNYQLKIHDNLSSWQDQNPATSSLDIVYITDGTFPEIEASIRKIFVQLPSNSLLILTAASGKGKKYSEENLRVPLVMYYPEKIQKGASTKQPVYTPDLFPTLTAFIQLNQNFSMLDGQSVYKYATRPATPINNRFLYWTTSGGQPTQILRFNQWKMVKNTPSSDWLLYDMITDPAETDNVAAYHPGKFQKFQEWIAKNH